jgi:hypothetical protein
MANVITFTVNEKKAIPVLINIGQAKGYELNELIQRAYRPNPDKKDIQELQKWLEEYPEIWCLVFDVAQVIEKNVIKRMVPEPASSLAIEKNVDAIRSDLGYGESPIMEMMLIDNIVLSWLRWQWAEYQLTIFMGPDGMNQSAIEFWERRVTAGQGRYLRACETLAKIRRLSQKNPSLQVNIATQSGQQVNIAGDIIKK